jgi:protein required for attachment to host cells
MKIDNGTLVAALDGTKLLLFCNDGDQKYPMLTTLIHEEAENPASREQGTDTPGRTHASAGDGRSSSYEETDWHEQTKQRFVRHAADVLEQAAAARPDAGVVVVAPATALGELRKHYGRATRAGLLSEVVKDLANHMTDDIVEAISAHNP